MNFFFRGAGCEPIYQAAIQKMIKPPVPETEAVRLAELRMFDIVDTVPERAYDAITWLASHICETPIALISIIDQDRQWFKSRVGIDVDETPRDLAFCAHAVNDPRALLVVPDATADPRFSGNPLVTGQPEIRFYAGAPLVTQSGQALGTLCVIDRSPRELTAGQSEALSALSVQVMALLELRLAMRLLKQKQDEVQAVMQNRDAFIASVSHEIRTPLTAVIGYVDLLSDPSANFNETERRDLMATIGRQAGDVSHLIDDLLVAAKAESGTLRFQSVNVNLAAQTAQVLEGLDPDSVESVRVDREPCHAKGDPSRVRQVIRNLITNAFRYGGPQISVASQRLGDRCLIEVSDDGSGIPEGEVDHVFEPFNQASHGTVVPGSVGLGLPISRLLAEGMGGSLTYERRNGESVFRLELPAAPL